MVRLKCTTIFYIICNIYIQKRVSLAWKYPKSTWFLHLKGPSNTFRLTARSCFQTQWLPWCTGCPGTSKLLAGAQRQWGQTCPAAEHNTVAKLVGKHYRKKKHLKIKLLWYSTDINTCPVWKRSLHTHFSLSAFCKRLLCCHGKLCSAQLPNQSVITGSSCGIPDYSSMSGEVSW